MEEAVNPIVAFIGIVLILGEILKMVIPIINAILFFVVNAVIFIFFSVASIGLSVAFLWLLTLVVVSLARSRPIRLLAIRNNQERRALRYWRWYIPSFLTLAWVAFSINFLPLPLIPLIFFVVLGAVLVPYFYFHHYNEKQPQTGDWSYFVQTSKLMNLDRRLAYIERSATMKAWWLSLWSQA